MFITMSMSCAPSFSTRAVSSRLEAASVAPSGNPMTTPTGTPVPASVSTAQLVQVGFTTAQAKRCSAASWHRRITCARVASGFSRVWSITAASAAAEERAWVAKEAASKAVGSAMESVVVVFISVLWMLLPGPRTARYFLS